MKKQIVGYSLDHPKMVIFGVLLMVLALGAMIPRIHIDTDPENMLPADEPSRVFHDEMKAQFGLHDMIVVGIVNNSHANGIYNPDTLENLFKLSKAIESIDGVIRQDLMSLSAVDNITQEGPGTIRFQWMMNTPPKTDADALKIQQAVERLPLLSNTMVSGDGKAAGIYVPIEAKDQSYRIASEIKTFISTLNTKDEFHITGLPIAEDTFGVEMFKQMALSAPLAGLVIFILMWYFFRSFSLITAPMIMSVAVVIATMGLLIGSGFTVHIMSSMIPIFIMPIAVVDSIHLLSEFGDNYKPGKDPKTAVKEVMDHLFTPMLYTSITSSIGFASLALTPIPPVQIFGLFVAFGILLAFILTVTFIPAYIALLSPKQLHALSNKAHQDQQSGILATCLRWLGQFSLARSKTVLVLALVVFAGSIYGIKKIEINDNPVLWFAKQHPLRIADKTLNQHFAGTYNAFIVLEHESNNAAKQFIKQADEIVETAANDGIDVKQQWQAISKELESGENFNENLQNVVSELEDLSFSADETTTTYWEKLLSLSEDTLVNAKYFQNPEALAYIEDLQKSLQQSGLVGKSNSIADLVKTVYRELKGGEEEQFLIPDNNQAVAQTLLSFLGSHRPNDLYHMVTPDYQSTAIWLQLKSGDNVDMTRVVNTVDQYITQNPLPAGVSLDWAGLTYINVIWQNAMVEGMIGSLISAFVAVLIIMVILFRSVLFGLVAMIPLTLTITFIYGIIGFVGKDYDMPVAILSSLTLGLSIDFAIHFIERTRSIQEKTGNWKETMAQMFEDPARAISRNAIVIAIGFTPLLAAPLVPYKTVGLFLATIMIVSCLVTLMLLPAVMQSVGRWLFGKNYLGSDALNNSNDSISNSTANDNLENSLETNLVKEI